MADFVPMTFYVGHHDAQRKTAVSEELFHHAEDLGYDTLTTRITNDGFHPRVLFQLSEYLRLHESSGKNSGTVSSVPVVSPLTAADTDLAPSDLAPRLLHAASPWIDIASPDPVIAEMSRQVLEHEVSYAAFCGATNILIHGPSFSADDAGLARYSRAIKRALELGPGVHFQILLPMSYDSRAQHEADFADMSRFAREVYVKQKGKGPQTISDMLSSWDVWHHIRSFCKYDSRLSIALTIPLHLPPVETQDRWHSEPIRILHFPKSTFTPNKFSVDVLAKPHQALISRYVRLKSSPWFLLSDIGPLPDTEGLFNDPATQPGSYANGTPPRGGSLSPLSMNPTPAESARQQKSAVHPSQKPLAHLEYIRTHLQQRQPAPTPLEQYGAGYQDFPQSPLQPLTDNLESVTYEVFEKDPVKYAWYERATAAALTDWRRLDKPRSRPGRVVVAVVGAGRGPLVQRALVAAEKARVDVDVWALEKNPSAFVHLHRRKREEWGDKVHLCQSDMRGWKGPLYPIGEGAAPPSVVSFPGSIQSADVQPAKVDILISELLGSFADNELSPECLDGVQHLLQPVHGISIPSSYDAHLTPIAAPRLWTDIAARGKLNTGIDATSIPYVAWLHSIDYLSTNPAADLAPTAAGATPGGASTTPTLAVKPATADASVSDPIVRTAWSFQHPVPAATVLASNAHNARYTHLTFPTPRRGVCHGLAGYFETVLYAPPEGAGAPVELSTHPAGMPVKSPDMISWFPIFFPLREPLTVVDGGEVGVDMWRQTDGRKVWYEWAVESWATVAGKRVKIGGSGLITSEREGCLM